ncbi:hypothetical protein F1880_000438 [Penicillium rolfsii]|nr:hypothetical protein F1880_000438 [Penicillium rolfsii]
MDRRGGSPCSHRREVPPTAPQGSSLGFPPVQPPSFVSTFPPSVPLAVSHGMAAYPPGVAVQDLRTGAFIMGPQFPGHQAFFPGAFCSHPQPITSVESVYVPFPGYVNCLRHAQICGPAPGDAQVVGPVPCHAQVAGPAPGRVLAERERGLILSPWEFRPVPAHELSANEQSTGRSTESSVNQLQQKGIPLMRPDQPHLSVAAQAGNNQQAVPELMIGNRQREAPVRDDHDFQMALDNFYRTMAIKGNNSWSNRTSINAASGATGAGHLADQRLINPLQRLAMVSQHSYTIGYPEQSTIRDPSPLRTPRTPFYTGLGSDYSGRASPPPGIPVAPRFRQRRSKHVGRRGRGLQATEEEADAFHERIERMLASPVQRVPRDRRR